MARQRKSKAGKAAVAELEREIGQLMGDLETRLDQLNSLAKRESKDVSNEISDFVADISDRVTDRARDGARAVGDEATQLGGDALRKIMAEVDKRPLLTLAIAASIGFIAGIARRA